MGVRCQCLRLSSKSPAGPTLRHGPTHLNHNTGTTGSQQDPASGSWGVGSQPVRVQGWCRSGRRKWSALASCAVLSSREILVFLFFPSFHFFGGCGLWVATKKPGESVVSAIYDTCVRTHERLAIMRWGPLSINDGGRAWLCLPVLQASSNRLAFFVLAGWSHCIRGRSSGLGIPGVPAVTSARKVSMTHVNLPYVRIHAQCFTVAAAWSVVVVGGPGGGGGGRGPPPGPPPPAAVLTPS